jgi:hypothetical protein
MHDREMLRAVLRCAFGPVAFPAHRGLRAAATMDEWNTDPRALADITAQQDLQGEWWEIPARELFEQSLGLTYLDAQGLEFYLPAYLSMALEDWTHRKIRLALEALDPGEPRGEQECAELLAYFEERLARIVGPKRSACLDFLEFAVLHLDPAEEFSGHADAVRIRAHPFWM